jgi:hypothetical protein
LVGGDPVPAETNRLVLVPSRLGRTRGPHGSTDGPRSPANESEAPLFVDFALPGVGAAGSDQRAQAQTPVVSAQLDATQLITAHLLLEAAQLPPMTAESVPIEVSRVIDAWDPAALNAAFAPRTSFRTARGWMPASRTARIDVTALVQEAIAKPNQSHGFAIRLKPNSSWGAAGKLALERTRLELYITQAERPGD